jgi:DNA-binding NarL/FixJ family response regulator
MAKLLFVVDDDPLTAGFVRLILKEKFSVQTFSSLADLYAAIDGDVEPDLIILDVHMPDNKNLHSLGLHRRNLSRFPVIAYSGARDDVFRENAIQHGFCDFVQKTNDGSFKSSIIKAVEENIAKWDKSLETTSPEYRKDLLTEREKEILNCLRGGNGVKDAAFELGISVSTVGSHLKNLREKLDMHSVEDIVDFSHGMGWLS